MATGPERFAETSMRALDARCHSWEQHSPGVMRRLRQGERWRRSSARIAEPIGGRSSHGAAKATIAKEVAMSISPVRYLHSGWQTLTPGTRPTVNTDALGEVQPGVAYRAFRARSTNRSRASERPYWQTRRRMRSRAPKLGLTSHRGFLKFAEGVGFPRMGRQWSLDARHATRHIGALRVHPAHFASSASLSGTPSGTPLLTGCARL
jgi:hypothetical protein